MPDPGDGENQVAPAFQIRLVDLETALAQRPWPVDVTGSLTIGVSDGQAPWNSGAWRLSFAGGHAVVEPTSIDTPDLVGSIEVWSQIYAGGITLHQAIRLGRLTASNDAAVDLLARATTGDPFFLFEFF